MNRDEIAALMCEALIGRLSIVRNVGSTDTNLFQEHVRIAACREAVEWADTLGSFLANSVPVGFHPDGDEDDVPMAQPVGKGDL